MHKSSAMSPWSYRKVVTALFYSMALLSGVFCRGSPPLDIYSLPRFLDTGNNFTFRAGEVAKLTCAVANLGERQVVWRQASENTPLTVGQLIFSEDPRLGVENNGTYWNLVIRDVQMSDAGVYECQISSKVRHLRHHVTLMVTKPIRTAPKTPNIQISGSDFVDEGQRIHLTCNATSEDYPLDDIDWFKAGTTLFTNRSRGMYIQKQVTLSTGTIVSTLEILHARLSDAGVYACRTSNKDVTSIYVNVLNGGTSNVKRDSIFQGGASEKTGAVKDPDNAGTKTVSIPWTLVITAFSTLYIMSSSSYRGLLELT